MEKSNSVKMRKGIGSVSKNSQFNYMGLESGSYCYASSTVAGSGGGDISLIKLGIGLVILDWLSK